MVEASRESEAETEVFGAVATSAMPQMVHLPGWSEWMCGCIGHR